MFTRIYSKIVLIIDLFYSAKRLLRAIIEMAGCGSVDFSLRLSLVQADGYATYLLCSADDTDDQITLRDRSHDGHGPRQESFEFQPSGALASIPSGRAAPGRNFNRDFSSIAHPRE